MQANKQKIYPVVAEKLNLPKELVQEIGDTVFKRWNDWQRLPENLRLSIYGLGFQYLRYAKTLKKKDEVHLDRKKEVQFDYFNPENNVFKDDKDKQTYEYQRIWYLRISELLEKYLEYKVDKRSAKIINYGVIRPFVPKEKKKADTTSKFNLDL